MNDLEFSTYENYKAFIASNGTSMYEYSTEFKELYDLLHNVPELDFTEEKEDLHKSIYSLPFFYDYQLPIVDKKKMLLRLKNSMNKLHKIIDEVLEVELKACEVYESADERFINQFHDTYQEDKKTTAEMCGRGETWIHSWKKTDSFREDFNGVYLKSYLTWLSKEKPKQFQEFKKNWKSRNK